MDVSRVIDKFIFEAIAQWLELACKAWAKSVPESVCVDFSESNVFGEHEMFYNWGGFSSDWDDSQVISVSWDGYKQHDAFYTSSRAGINQVIWWHPSGTESLLLYSLSPVWAASCQWFWIIHSAHVDFPADSNISLSRPPSPFLMEKLFKCETLQSLGG